MERILACMDACIDGCTHLYMCMHACACMHVHLQVWVRVYRLIKPLFLLNEFKIGGVPYFGGNQPYIVLFFMLLGMLSEAPLHTPVHGSCGAVIAKSPNQSSLALNLIGGTTAILREC